MSRSERPLATTSPRSSNLRPRSTFRHSLDQLVDAQEKRLWDCQPERLGGLQTDDEIVLGRLLHRDVGRLRPAQNLVNKIGGTPVICRAAARNVRFGSLADIPTSPRDVR